MREFLSHFSAAYFWRIPYLDNVLSELHANKRRADDPVHITVTDSNKRYRKNGYIPHLCKLPLPHGAVKKENEVYVASPELVFLQLANYLDMNRLIFLGLQMCAHPPGKNSEAITTKRKLKMFLEKTSGHRGHRKAACAVKYVENGSNSIMESIVYMVLTLPHSYGGYALTGAVLNHGIKSDKVLTTSSTKNKQDTRMYYVDLFFMKEKIAIEYDSTAHHSTPTEQGRDSIRATSLKLQGIDVISFTTIQLYKKQTCEEFAYSLASRLGREIRIRTTDFERSNRNLRKIFLT